MIYIYVFAKYLSYIVYQSIILVNPTINIKIRRTMCCISLLHVWCLQKKRKRIKISLELRLIKCAHT